MKRTALILASLSLVAAAAAPKLQVSEPWVRESNPARSVSSAYMILINPTARAITITGVASPAAKVVEMHEMKTVDGTMSMRRVDEIVVPPRSSIKLEPGGMHLMMIDLLRPLPAGETCALTLTIKDGGTVTVEAPVKNPDA